MGLSKYKLGQLIEMVTETNGELKYKSADVKGMTITKEIIPTKANVNDSDLSKFLVVRPQDFIFNPRTHGKRIGFGFNNTEDSFIISWNNIAFRISKEGQKLILPTYLFLHFNRTEWDREACFRSWGSSTEVFSWDALCEMTLDIPSIVIQRKYVDIYNAMVANQQSYEHGLSDLKLTCDAYIEELRRVTASEPIGKYLIQSDERNTLNLTADSVRGLSVTKEMTETKADMNGVSVDNYKIVPPRYIAYVADTSRRGDKMSLGFNRSNETFLVSSISTVFKTDSRYLLPEFLMLYVCRDEFDRYARFHSWGSARETFDWEEMCNVQIPVPDIEIQKDIVNIYEAYLTRKGINEKLKAQIKDICPILIKGSIKEARK